MIPGIIAARRRGGVVTGGLVAALDAKLYSSGQTWANEIAVPADGAPQSAYDYYLGTTSGAEGSDPTITDAGTDLAYWNFDGGDCFTLATAAASMTNFLKGMHKSGSKFTIEVWMRWGGVSSGAIQPLFDSGTADFGGAYTSRGITFDLGKQLTATNAVKLYVVRDSGGAMALSKVADTDLPGGVIQMTAVSFDGTGTDDSFFYRDGAYEQAGGVDTWDGTLSSPGTTDPSQSSRIGARGDAGSFVPSGVRVYLIRLYNRNLTKAELDANWNATRARFGL